MHLKIIFILTICLHFQNLQSIKDTTFIHQVMVVAADGGVDNYCGGGLVTLTWTLTSLKCIEDLAQNFHILEAVAGFNEENVANRQTRSIIKYISHVDKRNDIGLVQVDKPFHPSAELSLARLPQQGEAICDTATIVFVFPEKTTIESTEGLKQFGNYYFSKIKKTIRKLKMKVNGTVQEGILEVVSQTGINDGMDVDVAALVLGSKKIITNVRSKWSQRQRSKRRKGGRNSNSDEAAVFTGSVKRGPSRSCKGSKGWPLYCGDVIFGIETDCKQSEARANEEMGTYADVGSDADFIMTQAFGLNLNISKTKGSIQWSWGGANSIHGQNCWMKVLLMVVVVRVFYFYTGQYL